jgi:23S rRNA (adenine2503-C2)-methyltransferase
VSRTDRSRLDGTVKLTFDSQDGGGFSAVFLPHKGYNTLCLSTQVGCAWKCGFCASGLVPFERNLSSGEILDQIFWVEKETGEKITNILFMGMGEPLANFEGTVRSIGWMTSPRGLKMNPGRITLSTTGVAPMIEKLAGLKTRVNLALSLHAPTDELRRKIMPVSSKFPIREVLAACRTYQAHNDSDFTVEYILLKDVNDDLSTAEKLARLLQSAKFLRVPKINLIPHNPVGGVPYHAPTTARAEAFFRYLKGQKFIVHTRKPQGQDIEGACGQLL